MIAINRKDIEELTGYIHEHDNLQYAFMHKSSGSKFDIPFNNPLHKWAMPNKYWFKITSKAVFEYQDKFCLLDQNKDNFGQVDCYVKHLESVLGCKLPWDGSRETCTLTKRYHRSFNYIFLLLISM